MQAEIADQLKKTMRPMMAALSRIPDDGVMREQGNRFIRQFPPEAALKVASGLSFANPFFMPEVPAQAVGDLKVSLEQYAEFVMRSKMTARLAPQPNILVACAPKSASTFMQAAISRALGLGSACLFTATLDWASAGALGANLVEQEPDELALIRNGLNERGYVAQHHARCSPYLARMLACYNVRPVVTYRNIFDTIVSMDDMVLQWRAGMAPEQRGFFADALPSAYENLPRDDRMMVLAHRWTPWLVQFYVTWKRCARLGLTQPLFVSYEQDFLGDKALLAERLADHIGRDRADPRKLEAALADKSDGGAKRINQGIAGRGEDLPEAVRDYIRLAAGWFAEDEDLSPLLGQ